MPGEPPYDTEAVVTGSLIAYYPDKLPPNLSRLVKDAPESCSDGRHGEILAATRKCADDGEEVNVVTVSRRLKYCSPDYLRFLIHPDGTLPISAAESEAEQLCAAYHVRQTKSVLAAALAKIEAAPDEVGAIVETALATLAQIRKENGSNGGMPDLIDAADFLTIPIEPPAELVAGILHAGSKLAFGGSSKSFKTWSLLDLAISVATGVNWLGHRTVQGKVLFVNFEIQPYPSISGLFIRHLRERQRGWRRVLQPLALLTSYLSGL